MISKQHFWQFGSLAPPVVYYRWLSIGVQVGYFILVPKVILICILLYRYCVNTDWGCNLSAEVPYSIPGVLLRDCRRGIRPQMLLGQLRKPTPLQTLVELHVANFKSSQFHSIFIFNSLIYICYNGGKPKQLK